MLNFNSEKVASSFIIGRGNQANQFQWTGYDGLSHNQKHDLLYFFETQDCIDAGMYFEIRELSRYNQSCLRDGIFYFRSKNLEYLEILGIGI